MIIGKPPKNIDIRVFCGNNQLQRVYSTKILRITIDNNMNFVHHLENTFDKITSRLSYLSRIRHFLNLETLNKVFKALILPLFDYGNVVWVHTYEVHLDKLVKMQKKAARIITFSRFDEHSEQLFIKLNWMPVRDRIRLQSFEYTYKAINGLVAIASKDIFKVKTSRFSRRVGDDLKLELPKITSNFVKNSIFYIGAKIYNELNQETRNAKTFNSFLNCVIKDIQEM
jgi:hypothetical protein